MQYLCRTQDRRKREGVCVCWGGVTKSCRKPSETVTVIQREEEKRYAGRGGGMNGV